MRGLYSLVLLFLLFATGRVVQGQVQDAGAVARGVQYLRQSAAGLQAGEAALAGLALLKSEIPEGDPSIAACLRIVEGCFNGTTYTPSRSGPGGHSVYEAAVVSMFLVNLDHVAQKPRIDAVAAYLAGNQLPNGCWDYAHRQAGDCSISQYAVLGLWEAENAGARVSPRVWEAAARWYLAVQEGDGSWRYHPDELGQAPTISITAAGVGSLLICRRQLEKYRGGQKGSNPLLNPLLTDPGDVGDYKVQVPVSAIDAGMKRGLAWIVPRFTGGSGGAMGQSPYYGLYGIERIGALSDRETLGGVDWFERGRQYILASQAPGGGWTAQHGDVPNTAWAMLFLTRSTAKSLKRIEVTRLGSGTLIGGRGLPEDLTTLSIAGGRVLVQPMKGAIDEMLAVLEDPRAEKKADAALSGLVTRYHAEGPECLKPHRDRFRRLLREDADASIRELAAWGLARCGEMGVIPDLAEALVDPDEAVVRQARLGLQLLSRKLEGFGPPDHADPQSRKAAAQKWLGWYESLSGEAATLPATGGEVQR